MTASILPFRRQAQGHGLTADDLDRLALRAEYLPGRWRLDVPANSDRSDAPKVWLRPQNEERATFPDIGFMRVAGTVWVTTKNSGDASRTSYATVEAAVRLLCQIMLSDEAIGPSQRR